MSIEFPQGYGHRVLASLDSTNSEAARIASDLAHHEWILALEQTVARGRRGRPWGNPRGNFAATLVLICEGEGPATMALRSFVASLALYDALTAVSGRADGLALKWPNDVLLNGGKVAGILLENLPNDRLAIGIGVNLLDAPGAAQVEADATRPVSLMSETGAQVGVLDLLSHLAHAYAAHEDTFRTHGFTTIRTAWLARAAKLGERIMARTGNDELTGTFMDVDVQGNMILKTASGTRRHRGRRHLFLRARLPCCFALTPATPTPFFPSGTATKFLMTWRTSTEWQRTADQYFVWLSTLLEANNIDVEIDEVIISSTVPARGA